mgnify:CR=1 FL=1
MKEVNLGTKNIKGGNSREIIIFARRALFFVF